MKNITYHKDTGFSADDIRHLYDDAGWTVYTDDLPRLVESIARSLLVVTAWDKNRLVGLIRVIGDGGISIIYIQDLLVLKAYRRKGIGTRLVKYACDTFKSARQKVLLTDDTPAARGFYESLGFASCDKGELVAYTKFE